MSLPPPGPPPLPDGWQRPPYPPPGTPIPAPGGGPAPRSWGPPGTPVPPAASFRSRPRRRRVIAGIAVIAGGAVAGAALLGAALLTANAALEGFARAPAGCTTVLEFDEPGEYSVFVETSGDVRQLPGDCPWSGEFDYEGRIGDLPLRLVDPSAADVPITAANGTLQYDLPWRTGQSVGTVAVDQAGDYRMTVGWTGSPAVVAVGRWPVGEMVAWALSGIGVGLAALVVGIWLLVGGRRRNISV